MGQWIRTVGFAALPFLIRALWVWVLTGEIFVALFRPTEITFYAIMIGANGLVEAGRFEEESKDAFFENLETILWIATIVGAVMYGFLLPSEEGGAAAKAQMNRLLIISTVAALVNSVVATWIKWVVEKSLEEDYP